MLQAPGLDEADSDDDSVVSVEETAEETRQRRLLKKQLQRRDRDKALRREQSRKRVQKEKDMMIQSKLAAEAEAARRVASWGPIMMADAAKVGAPPREQDLPKDRAETAHPATWSNYPKKRLGEIDIFNPALKTPVCYGYRSPWETENPEVKIPLPKKFRDPGLLEKRCRVCAWSVDGCPGCWRPAKRAIAYKKMGNVKGAVPDGVGAKGSFGKGAVSHTKLTSPAAIAFARKGMCFVTVYVKAVPAGDIIKLTLQSSDPISYLCWQFRNQDPVVGYNESMALLFPTEGGLILASPLKTFGSDLTPAYDYGSYKLSDYKINSPGAVASFFYVNKISDSMTPRLFQAFYRSNFTLSRPWLTRTLSHMSLIPPGGLATDEAQVRISEWMATSRVEVEKWILAEAEEIKAKREKGDAVEAAAKTDAELAEKKVTIRKWQKARRRDARDKLLAALGDEGAP